MTKVVGPIHSSHPCHMKTNGENALLRLLVRIHLGGDVEGALEAIRRRDAEGGVNLSWKAKG